MPSMHRCFSIPKTIIVVLLIGLLQQSCSRSSVSEITPLSPSASRLIEQHCHSIFTRRALQFVHSLQFSLPGSSNASVIGITNVFPRSRSLEIIMMTVEGLVLFHARHREDHTEVLKSIDVFKSDAFSRGLIGDIQLIFLEPDGSFIKSGVTEDRTTVCRFQDEKGEITDIYPDLNNGWEIRHFNARQQPTRTVSSRGEQWSKLDRKTKFPYRLTLESHRMVDYRITMTLLQTDLITGSP